MMMTLMTIEHKYNNQSTCNDNYSKISDDDDDDDDKFNS